MGIGNWELGIEDWGLGIGDWGVAAGDVDAVNAVASSAVFINEKHKFR
ncbi:hypothetical protein [Scytonema millei]